VTESKQPWNKHHEENSHAHTHSLQGPAVLGCLLLLSLNWMSCGAATFAQGGKSDCVVASAQGATEPRAIPSRKAPVATAGSV
jgi:hypothetical protein